MQQNPTLSPSPPDGTVKLGDIIRHIIASVAALLVGGSMIAAVINGILTNQQIDEAQTWIPAAAHVDGASFYSSYMSGRSRSIPQRIYEFSYTYDFAGTTYSSTAAGWYTEEEARRAVEALREDRNALMCYVNPHQPSEAVLFRNTWKKEGSLLYGFGGLGLLSLLFSASCFRDLRKAFSRKRD